MVFELYHYECQTDVLGEAPGVRFASFYNYPEIVERVFSVSLFNECQRLINTKICMFIHVIPLSL